MELPILLIAALLPAVILAWLIYRKDVMQPEPKGEILKACGWGVVSAFASFTISYPLGLMWGDGTSIGIIDSAFDAFFQAAVPEEVAKFACLYFFIRKNKYFDEYMDGIVYASAVALGFAGIENIMYLISNIEDGWQMVAVMRALFSVPGHYAFGVLMGYFFALWWFRKDKMCGMLMLAVPIIAHGIFDYLLMVSPFLEEIGGLIIIVFLIFVVMMHKFANKLIAHQLQMDKYNTFVGQPHIQAMVRDAAHSTSAALQNSGKERAGVVAVICSFLFPIVGFICYGNQKDKVSNPKSYLWAAVAGMVLNMITRLLSE